MPVLVPYKSQKTCAQKEMNVQEDEEKPAFLLLGSFGERRWEILKRSKVLLDSEFQCVGSCHYQSIDGCAAADTACDLLCSLLCFSGHVSACFWFRINSRVSSEVSASPVKRDGMSAKEKSY